MRHTIDPTIDCVFKAILGSNEHINLLHNFLNSICKDALHSPICDLIILNPCEQNTIREDRKIAEAKLEEAKKELSQAKLSSNKKDKVISEAQLEIEKLKQQLQNR